MLYPGEIADVDSQLAVHSPHYASVHGHSKDVKPSNTTILSDSLNQDGVEGTKVYDY
jgi:hypothetical protein